MAALALAHFFDEPVSPLGAPRWAADADVDDVEVDQAIGMVMAHLHASTETALAILRARAFTDGRLLGEVAREVLACKITFEPGEYGET